MEFYRLRYFLEVCRHGRISKAASACHVSQPSLSLQIQKLEESLGGSLFLRNRDGLKLTELGESFLPHAQAIMAEVEAAQEFQSEQQSGLQGVIRIGAIPTIAPYCLPQLLKGIHAQHPAVTFDIVEDTTDVLIERLRSGGLDFAILSPPTAIDADTDFLSLGQDELLLTLPEGHTLESNEHISLDALASQPLVLLTETHCLSQQCEHAFRSSKVSPEVRMRSSQIATLLGIVESGLGITFTPRMALENHRNRKVSFHSLQPEPYSREIRMVWMRRHRLSHKQKGVLKIVEDLIESEKLFG